MEIKDKVIVVTGAARGLGKNFALDLANRGAKLALADINQELLEEVRKTCEQAGTEARAYDLNVAEEKAVEVFFDQAVSDFGTVDVLINNAGITRDGLLMRMRDGDWDEVLEVNMTASMILCRAAMRSMMKARSGRIISISSIVGVTGNPGQANYAASKAGMIGFSKSLAAEVASRGITVNIVAPGFIETPMTDVLDEGQKANLLTRVPAGRLGKPKEIAASVVFLASDEAAYVTGMTMHVNGGMAML